MHSGVTSLQGQLATGCREWAVCASLRPVNLRRYASIQTNNLNLFVWFRIHSLTGCIYHLNFLWCGFAYTQFYTEKCINTTINTNSYILWKKQIWIFFLQNIYDIKGISYSNRNSFKKWRLNENLNAYMNFFDENSPLLKKKSLPVIPGY